MEQSFEDVFEAEVVPLRRYLARRLGVDVADDLTAETFAIAYRKWEKLDREKPVRPWLYGIATKLVLHHRRKERRRLVALARSSVDPLVSNDDPSVVARMDASAQKTLLAGALAELRPPEREVILLHAWADLGDSEIAAALGIPLGTVKSRMHRARQNLGNRLAASGRVEMQAINTTIEETTR
jgi:RNA polymerase sigma-70 factor (ECF subfamily)